MANKWFQKPGSHEESSQETQPADAQAAEPMRQGGEGQAVSPNALMGEKFGIYSKSLMEQKMEALLYGDFKSAAEDMRRDILPHVLAYTLRHIDRKVTAIQKELGL